MLRDQRRAAAGQRSSGVCHEVGEPVAAHEWTASVEPRPPSAEPLHLAARESGLDGADRAAGLACERCQHEHRGQDQMQVTMSVVASAASEPPNRRASGLYQE